MLPLLNVFNVIIWNS